MDAPHGPDVFRTALSATPDQTSGCRSIDFEDSKRKPGIMCLPRELRDKIYGLTTEQGPTSSAKYDPIPLPVTCFVNRQMRRESLALYLATARWEFDVRKVPYGKGEMNLLKAWLSALGDDARHLARFKFICRLKHYRWEVYMNLVADEEENGARNVEVDERDERGLWPGAVGIIAFKAADRTHYRAMFPGYAPSIWKGRAAYSSGSGGNRLGRVGVSSQKNLQLEINEYIQDVIIHPLIQKRWDGSLTGWHIVTAIEGLLAYEWQGC
ncbi:hypothetical protein MPH_06345 [Macrophomina phaseolina MS6]|uniref:Uncharacterized protein n=1 Tax=Macrophomina phaseolina (strain MS6) TaxID=1126212 RepID=K2SHV8_MACPH|nr:hypothetical protein MPH_06345 [Macrophomina phaseolina MS6]